MESFKVISKLLCFYDVIIIVGQGVTGKQQLSASHTPLSVPELLMLLM